MTAKTARIPSPMLNNPAPEIKLAPERDAVMATAPRRKSFPPIITEAAPKAKIHRSIIGNPSPKRANLRNHVSFFIFHLKNFFYEG